MSNGNKPRVPTRRKQFRSDIQEALLVLEAYEQIRTNERLLRQLEEGFRSGGSFTH